MSWDCNLDGKFGEYWWKIVTCESVQLILTARLTDWLTWHRDSPNAANALGR